MANQWYYAANNEKKGPISSQELQQLIVNRQITPESLVWAEGLEKWTPAGKIRKLAELFSKLQNGSNQQVTSNTAAQAGAVWYFVRDGKKQGPVTAQVIKKLAAEGRLTPNDKLWKAGLKEWVAAGSLPGLKFSATSDNPPPAAQPTAQSAADTSGDASPDENSIFDIMNDPSFASAPAASEGANAGLMTLPKDLNTGEGRKKVKKSGGGSGFNLSNYTEVILWLTVAMVLLGFSIWRYFYLADLRENGVVAVARVVEIEETRGRRGRRNHYPIVNFQTEDGRQMRVKTSQSGGYNVGEQVEVIYMPGSPEKAEIVGSSALSSTFNFWTIGVVICLILAGHAFYKTTKE